MPTKSLLILFTAFALVLAPQAQQSQPQAKSPAKKGSAPKNSASTETGTAVEQQAVQTVEATMNWDKSSSPGLKVSTELIKKGEVKGHQVYEYRVKVTGAPPNQIYKLMVWPVTTSAPVLMLDGLVIAKDGTVGCPAGSADTCAQRFKGAELKLPYAAEKGEIYRHALISRDQKTRAFFSILPDPIIQTDKACTLEAIRLSPNFELVAVRGKGFEPGTDVVFHTQSFQEVHTAAVQPDKNGQFHAQLTPFVKGRTSGTIEISATGHSCAPHLSFEWGKP